nr:phosphohydrolase [Acetivibrio straminisolvens]
MNRYIIAFFLFSFLGFVWESVYFTICKHKWANRRSLPVLICMIYGCGALLAFLAYDLIESGLLQNVKWWMIFILGFIISLFLGYIASLVLEKLFKARWWDYSNVPLNINGRASVPTSVAFGVLALLLVKALIPLVDRGLSTLSEPLIDISAYILVSIVIIDTTLSISLLTDFQKYVVFIDEGFQNYVAVIVKLVYGKQDSCYYKVIQRIMVFKFPRRKNRLVKQLREKRFVELTKDYFESDVVKQMDKYIHHGTTTTLQHCENVAWISYLVNKKLKLNANEKELIGVAMLHDLFLYDWHDGEPCRKTHGFDHPEIACNNAIKHFGIPEKQQQAILSHMWPLNITKIPKSRVALIICMVDKYCALMETIRLNKRFGLRY